MRPEHIEDILVALHAGQWFGWSDSKDKVYGNLVIYSADDKPTQEWLEAEVIRQQGAWDAEQTSKQERLDSVKSKLEALGLTTEEVQEAFGL
jgi:hypothetical protein